MTYIGDPNDIKTQVNAKELTLRALNDKLEAIKTKLNDGALGVQLNGSIIEVKEATIALNESLTDEIDLGGVKYLAFVMPSAWTAADITFQASATAGGTFADVYDDIGNEVSIKADASRVITIDINALKIASLQYIKLRSGTSAAPVAQEAERTITIIGKL